MKVSQQIINRGRNGQFGKGSNPNPHGSRGKALSSASNEFLRIFHDEVKEEWPAMVKSFIKMVKEENNTQGFKLICEYMIGKPAETINVNNESVVDSLPFISSKEGRAQAAEIFKKAMEEVEKLNESHD